MSTNKLTEEMNALMTKGKEAFYSANYPEALTKLSEACRVISKEFGEFSEEMIEPYYLYARSLFESVKFSPDVIDGVDVDITDTNNSKVEDTTETNKEEQNEDENNEAMEVEKGENDDENISAFQLSFENVECAKKILSKLLDSKSNSTDSNSIKDNELKLADCYDLMGHIMMEDNNDNGCINEYLEALNIRTKHNAAELEAESHLNLGKAYCNVYDWRKAKSHYQSCQEIITNLRSKQEPDSKKYKEYDGIISDLNERLEDVAMGLREFDKAKKLISEIAFQPTKLGEGVVVNNINNLVRKKPKMNE